MPGHVAESLLGLSLWRCCIPLHLQYQKQNADVDAAHSRAVPAAGSPLAACLLGPGGMVLHHLVFPLHFQGVRQAHLSSPSTSYPGDAAQPQCCCHPVPAWVQSCTTAWRALGEAALGLSSNTNNHFWVSLQAASLLPLCLSAPELQAPSTPHPGRPIPPHRSSP